MPLLVQHKQTESEIKRSRPNDQIEIKYLHHQEEGDEEERAANFEPIVVPVVLNPLTPRDQKIILIHFLDQDGKIEKTKEYEIDANAEED